MDVAKIGIVTSRFHIEVTEKLYKGAIQRLNELGHDEKLITSLWVPGAVEIPITAERLAVTGKYAAVICLGAVIFGETRHFDYVCQQVSYGCQKVSLTHHIPIIFGVLTTDNLVQAHERAGGSKGNMGAYAASSAIELISILKQI